MHKNICMVNYTIINEYERLCKFISGVRLWLPKKEFAELREDFQVITKPEQDIFLMAQLRSMDGGAINTSQRLKKKLRVNKRTFYC